MATVAASSKGYLKNIQKWNISSSGHTTLHECKRRKNSEQLIEPFIKCALNNGFIYYIPSIFFNLWFQEYNTQQFAWFRSPRLIVISKSNLQELQKATENIPIDGSFSQLTQRYHMIWQEMQYTEYHSLWQRVNCFWNKIW